MIVPINHLPVEMTKDEHEYFQQLSQNLSDNGVSISNQLRGVFEVDENGIIVIIKPIPGRQIQWGLLFFLQNLMINQRLRRIEDFVGIVTKEEQGV